ncbi:unnamed protein product [Adineta ricciae]|uniref:Uncharacterized protein n=1 Tax=Adineta ricciae TaxID=249248 RepID=A0A814JYE7_ADIRI|nr:unnamed protein product [Adineta ricciae]CAF1568045.1 unnamed protein product [Adineta ricciae]
MTTIRLFPVHQTSLCMTNTSVFYYLYHFGLRTRISWLFTWFLRLQFLHFVAVVTSFSCALWPQTIRTSVSDFEPQLTFTINGSSVVYSSHESAVARRCFLSLTVPIKIKNYMDMIFFNVLLCVAYFNLIMCVQQSSIHTPPKSLGNPYRWFCWGRRILVLFLSSSILNQVVCATACRPVEIFYDPRHIFMFSVHLFNFFVCTGFSFFLGVKFTSIRPEHRRSTS